MQQISNRNKENISLNEFYFPKEETIPVEKLKEIYDNFLLESSSLSSSNNLINILHLLENIDKTILLNRLIVNHEFNYFLTNKLYHLLKKFYKLNYLNESEAILFGYLGRNFFRINFNPEKLIRPIRKCISYISNYEKYLSYEDYLKDFHKLIYLYIQNEEILNAILNCLCSKYYIQLIEQTVYHKFLLIDCPSYWIAYKGPNKEEMSNKLLNQLLVTSSIILPQKYPKKFSKVISHLIDLLNKSFIECNPTLLINDDLILLTDSILSIFNDQSLLEERRSIRKSSIQLLITLINKFEIIFKYVKQRQDTFNKLINIENHFYLILASLMNNNQIKNTIKQNQHFNQFIREYINQQNNQEFYQNDLFTKRLKLIMEPSSNEPGQSILSADSNQNFVGNRQNQTKSNRSSVRSSSNPMGVRQTLTKSERNVAESSSNPLGVRRTLTKSERNVAASSSNTVDVQQNLPKSGRNLVESSKNPIEVQQNPTKSGRKLVGPSRNPVEVQQKPTKSDRSFAESSGNPVKIQENPAKSDRKLAGRSSNPIEIQENSTESDISSAESPANPVEIQQKLTKSDRSLAGRFSNPVEIQENSTKSDKNLAESSGNSVEVQQNSTESDRNLDGRSCNPVEIQENPAKSDRSVAEPFNYPVEVQENLAKSDRSLAGRSSNPVEVQENLTKFDGSLARRFSNPVEIQQNPTKFDRSLAGRFSNPVEIQENLTKFDTSFARRFSNPVGIQQNPTESDRNLAESSGNPVGVRNNPIKSDGSPLESSTDQVGSVSQKPIETIPTIFHKDLSESIQAQWSPTEVDELLEEELKATVRDVRDTSKGPVDLIVVSNENENKEEITLIWYDTNIGIRDDTNKTFELFRQINDYVLIYSQREAFLDYIDEVKTEKVLLILSGSSTEDILNDIHDKKQIDSIFIFDINREKYEIYLNNEKYDKIIGIYTEHQPLLIAIEENIRYVIKQSEAASLFDQEERAMRNLNRHLYEFRSFLIFKQVLLKTEYNNDMAKKQMIEMCRNYYRNNNSELIDIEEFERTYKPQDAIYWYTRQTFVYRLVNKALRTEDYEAILMLRFFIVDLCKNIKEQYEQLKEKEESSNIIVSYRGLKSSPSEIHNLKHNIGKIVATSGFLSTTRSKNVAYTFATKGIKRSNVEIVMLEIDVDISKSTASLADVAEYSDFPQEEEILFDLGASFIINSIDYDDIQKIWLVKLTAVSEESCMKNIQTYLTEKGSSTNMNISLGQVFFMMEKYDTCRKYFENMLNLYENEDYENLAKIHDYIGQAYENENDYDKAIINYTKSCHCYNLLNRLEDVARITNYIGIMYFNKSDKINARIHFTKSYDLWKELKEDVSSDQNCEIARLMNCFGCLEDDNLLARDYLLKALNIYENPSHICHLDNHDYYISQISEYLAEKYFHDNDQDKALKYIIKSVNIRQKYISSINGKINLIKSLMKLWKICEKNDENIWLTYQDRFLELVDIETIKSIPELNDFINDAILFKKSDLDHKQDDKSESNDLLKHSLNSLNFVMITDPENYEKIIQLHIDVGLAFAKTNDYHWASEHYTKALEMCNTYTPNHSKLLSTIFQCLSDISLADKIHYQDNFNNDIKSININEKTSQLTDLEKEAQSYFDTGETLMTESFDKALEFFKKSLEIREKYLKEDDIVIGICHQDIGATYINKSMHDVALEHYIKAIQIYEKHLDDKEEHQLNVKSLYGKCHCDIGRIYHNKKQYEKSNEYFIKTIKMMEDHLSSENVCFISDCYEGIGLNYYKISEYDLSIVFYGKCFNFLLTHMKSSLLCDHRKEIASCLIDLSCVYIDKKEYKLALENLQKISHILPEDHKDLANSFLFIGLCYMEQRQYELAVKNYQYAIQHFEKHLPFNQQNYALCLSHLGTCYSNMEKNLYDNGINCILKAVDIYQQNPKENRSNIAQCYWISAFILSKKGKFDEAIQNVYKSLEFRVDEDTINVGLSHNLLGLCYYKKCQYEQALSSLIISMENYEKHLSDLNNEIGASIFYDIATSLLKLNNYDQALEYAIRSLELREDILPLIDLQKSESHSLLALIYSQKEIQQYEKCNEHCIKALQLAEQVISTEEDIENIGEIYENIAEVCLNVNSLQQARDYYEKALKYMKIDKIDDHVDIHRIQKIIDSLTKTLTET